MNCIVLAGGRDVPSWADIQNIADLSIERLHERNAHLGWQLRNIAKNM